jgi:hypothetical protein
LLRVQFQVVTDSDVQPIFLPKMVMVPLAQLLTVKENLFKLQKPYVIEISSIGLFQNK